MKEIPVRNRKGIVAYALVDDEDYEWLSAFRWHFSGKGYVSRSFWNGSGVSHERMSRMIMNAPKGKEVDHRDLNKLNNRRSNLRLATHRQNGCNTAFITTPKSSRFKGVSWIPRLRKWTAYIGGGVTKTRKYLGVYQAEEEAAQAYNQAALEMYGEWASPNKL